MGFALDRLRMMSMDDFGFFSEASSAARAGPSSSLSSSRSRPPAQHGFYQSGACQQNDDACQRQVQATMQPLGLQHQRWLQQQQQFKYPHGLNPSDSAATETVPLTHTRSDSERATAYRPTTPNKRGSNLACLKCRAIKVKCRKTNPNDPRCSRCNRLDLFCEFREHHRGKKLEKVIADENRLVTLNPEMLLRARHDMLGCSSYPLNLDLASMALSDNAQDATYFAKPFGCSSQPFPIWLGSPAHSGATELVACASTNPVRMASSVYDDVLQINACSWTDACYLFSLFITQLNPILALLDANLHKVQYTREQSPILFSTILCVASRFFRPSLHSQCQAAAAAILSLASSRQVCSIDHIQALIVSAIWATPGDPSRSEWIAAAIAYAYELGLCFSLDAAMPITSAVKPYTPPLALHLLDANHQSVVLRVQQRTWIQLCLLELSQQTDSQRASMPKRPELIAQHDFPNVRTWYQLHHLTMSAYDTRLAYQLDIALSQRNLDRLAASIQANTAAATISQHELSNSIDMLLVQQRECFATWFNVLGEEYVARYAMDRYSSMEAGFVLLLYRFGRAVQLHSIASSFSSYACWARPLQERWLATATELAFRVLDYFSNKILDQDSTSSSTLRFSPQYMASGCLAAARWVLHPSYNLQNMLRARERISETMRLLAQPQFYPDGIRLATSNELTGKLDHALRSLMSDARMLLSPGASTGEEQARAQEANLQQQQNGGALDMHDWADRRKQRRRNSNASCTTRIDVGSIGSTSGMSEYTGSDRGGANEPSPFARSTDTGANLSIDLRLSDSSWPTSLMLAKQGSWTPKSEGGFNMPIPSSSISPSTSECSAMFSLSAPTCTMPDLVNIASYGCVAPTTATMTTPPLSVVRSGDVIAPNASDLNAHPHPLRLKRAFGDCQYLSSDYTHPEYDDLARGRRKDWVEPTLRTASSAPQNSHAANAPQPFAMEPQPIAIPPPFDTHHFRHDARNHAHQQPAFWHPHALDASLNINLHASGESTSRDLLEHPLHGPG